MTADQHRVRVVVRGGRSWLTEPLDRDAAVEFMRTAAEQVRTYGEGSRLLAWPVAEAPTAFIRARDVVAFELATLPAPTGHRHPGPATGARP